MNPEKLASILRKLRRNPKNARFKDLCGVCNHYFGPPWPGDPRINIQNHKGRAKAYQVKQVIAAIDMMEADNEPE